MRKILVATDFSERSDRAIRRASLLAKRFEASLFLVHVIDDDQPPRLVEAEQQIATDLLAEHAHSIRELDGLNCDFSVVLGKPFKGIIDTAAKVRADLLVIGSHRRQVLKDVFTGTTAERTIRESNLPVLMANGVPTSHYRNAIIAVDLSPCSGDAVRAMQALELTKEIAVSVVHVFDVFALGLMNRAASTEDEIKAYIADEEERISGELAAFLRKVKMEPVRQELIQAEDSIADTICAAAGDLSAQLVVVGTHGRTGVDKFFLGSVAEEVLRIADHDVLVVPPRSAAGGG